MAGYRSERPIDPHVSPYLQRPLRTLKEAEQDSDRFGPSSDVAAVATGISSAVASRIPGSPGCRTPDFI